LAILHEVFAADKLSFSVRSEALPGAERSFGSLSGAAREATLSRIFAGVHFRFDLTAGETLGRQVAGLVTHHLLTPRRGGSEEGAKHRDRSGNAVSLRLPICRVRAMHLAYATDAPSQGHK